MFLSSISNRGRDVLATIPASLVGIVMVAAFLTGCATTRLAPIQECNINDASDTRCASLVSSTKQHVYVVQRGDTLREVARKFNLQWTDLARLNGLQAPYPLNVGQELRLTSAAPSVDKSVTNASAPLVCPLSGPKPAGCTPPSSATTAPSAPKPIATGLVWAWPVKGKVTEQFSERNTGIDIEAPIGTPVYAAADGEVKYADNKLRGYGNLIVIAHANGYMSTYAHNKVLLVKENDRVTRGQKIAEVGQTDAVKPMLQFEIRKGSNPVDPLKILPKQ